MKHYRFIISGGGTGGHIYPAIAIANELKNRYPEAEFLFVGAKDRMEMEKVPQAGYKIKGLWISGLQRNLKISNLMFPLKLASSLIRAKKILKAFKPHIAIGTGGYASAPLLRIASSRKIPTLIQEQNSHAGLTNKWLSKRAHTICVAYEDMDKFFPKEKLVFTGNPVRQDLLNLNTKRGEGQSFFNIDNEKKTLLVLGGSLGALKINQLIENKLEFFENNELQLIWQCGKYYYETYKDRATKNVQVHSFLDRMDLAYASADIIISRSGALSVSELCLVGKPVIFIPSPNVTEDHQTKNAQAIAKQDAAILIKEEDLETKFESEFSSLLKSQAYQAKLSEQIKKLAKPEATKAIVAQVEKLLINTK